MPGAKATSNTKTPKTSKNKFSKETYMTWYRQMKLMRKFEEKAGQLYGQQKIRGFCHLYIGQEACVAGAVSALTKDDSWITAYRDHAHPLALGSDPKVIMAELFGKETGISKGKGGSMHMFDAERNFFGGHGIVGGQIPLGTGIGFAEKYKTLGSMRLLAVVGYKKILYFTFIPTWDSLVFSLTKKVVPLSTFWKV